MRVLFTPYFNPFKDIALYDSPFLLRISMKPFSINNWLNCAAVYFFPCIFNRSVKVYALRTILHLSFSFAGDGVSVSMHGRFSSGVCSVETGISIIGKPFSSAIFFISSSVEALSAPPNLCKAPTHSISSCTVWLAPESVGSDSPPPHVQALSAWNLLPYPPEYIPYWKTDTEVLKYNSLSSWPLLQYPMSWSLPPRKRPYCHILHVRPTETPWPSFPLPIAENWKHNFRLLPIVYPYCTKRNAEMSVSFGVSDYFREYCS